ncbi:MAG: ankyrin repeat domain-containing protein, partial [Shewanella sp.]|nr:ankyrin repeat domain-containing protein [Shewanella sp.]
AAKYGHLKCVKLLVESGAKKDIKNDEDATPLMTATFRGHHEIVEYLIDKGASPDSFTAGLKMTPVMYAAKAGHSACVAKLLPKSQDIGKQNASGNTALMIASEKGYEAVVNIILMHENSSDWINTENQDGNTALSLAAVNGRCGIVTLLLNNDARTDILNKGNQTAYQRALWNGKNACVQVIKNHVSTPIDSIFRDGIELTVKQYDEV